MDQKDKAMWVHKLWDPLEKIEESPLHSKKEGIKVAAYCRVSVDSHGLSHSLECQVSHYTHLINNRENWTFVGIYFDNLVTGRKASLRRGFTRMLRHCEENKIDLILVKNVSRFSRNTKELIEVVERLKELGIAVYFEAENITTTNTDTTYLLKTYAAIAQGEIEDMSQRAEWSYHKKALEGKVSIKETYGYEKIKKEGEASILVNGDEARVVVEIYNLYLGGNSYRDIAKELNRRNIKTKQGKNLWRSSTVIKILSNISYTGDLLVGKTSRDLLTNKKRSAEGIKDQIFIENHHVPIISREVFNMVQDKMENSKKVRKPQKLYDNPLLKRALCGNCGFNFNRHNYTGKTYYKCSTAFISKSLCVSTTIREDALVMMMLRAFQERFETDDPKIIKRLQKMLIKINQNDHFEFHRLKALTQIQLAKKLKDIQYTDADIKLMEERYEEFENQLEKIEDDRKYRLEAVEWLGDVENFKVFEKEATIEYVRGWILEITIFSSDDYKIKWIDGTETQIGNCIPVPKVIDAPLVEPMIKGDFVVQKNKKLEDISEITLEEGGDENVKEESKMPVVKKEVSELIFLNIKKQINGSVEMYSNLCIAREEKLKVAAYIRVSTDSAEQEISLKAQYSYFLYLILKNPHYILVDIYIDDGKSGMTTKGRTEFNRLIKDCKLGKVNLIITKSVSRFARNVVDTLTYLDLLKNLESPVNVWFQKENLYSLDDRSNLLIKLISVIGQEESLNLGESVAWGKRRLAERGIVRPSHIGYGYYYGKNKEWLINEEEAKIVKRIFRECLDGKNMLQIARLLTEESVPTPNGQKNWYHGTIYKILTSETYRGNYVYQRTYSSPGLSKDKMINQGELPMYYIEQNHQGIIESEDWEKVQEIIIAREKDRQEKIEKYPQDINKNDVFSKKLHCGKCGRYLGYVRHINKSADNKENRRWRCYKALKGEGCDALHLKQEYIEENFSQCLLDIKFNSAFSDYLGSFMDALKITSKDEMIRDELIKEKEELNQKLYEEVQGELNKKGKDAKKADKLIDEIMKLRQRVNDFNAREIQLEAIKNELEIVLESMKEYKDSTKDDIGYYINPPEFSEELFNKCIDKAIVHEDGRIVYLFNSGFEWGFDINYADFQKKARQKIALKRAAEREEYLRGPEVKKLLEYCKEPKTSKEMMSFLGKYSSWHSFSKHIAQPLLEEGILRRTIPERHLHRMQKYYSVEK